MFRAGCVSSCLCEIIFLWEEDPTLMFCPLSLAVLIQRGFSIELACWKLFVSGSGRGIPSVTVRELLLFRCHENSIGFEQRGCSLSEGEILEGSVEMEGG